MHGPILVVFAAGCVIASTLIANAQEPRLALSDPRAFRESFSASAPSGTRAGTRAVETLVGVRIGPADDPFDPASLRVAIGPSNAQGTLCLRMISRDGRYSASARYTRDTVTPAMPLLDVPTRFPNELRGIAKKDMAVQAFSAPDCADFARATELFATVNGSPTANDMLILQINAPASRVRAQLLRADAPVTEAILCLPIDGARVGFSNECRLPLATVRTGAYRLVMNETTSTGAQQSRTYAISLSRDGVR